MATDERAPTSGWTGGWPPSWFGRWSLGLLQAVTLVAALSAPLACGKDPAPVTTAKAFASAAQRGDSKALLELVDSDAAAYLESSAERASDQIGGRRSIETHEMLQVIDIDPRFQVAKAELVESTDTTARVNLLGADGSERSIDLVYQDERWRVVVPLPTSPAATS